uniref:Uncharacterized protein n=1 Tax=Glossina pallidipes TaxID=7398 RepID=A0A1B0AH70_GLOPL
MSIAENEHDKMIRRMINERRHPCDASKLMCVEALSNRTALDVVVDVVKLTKFASYTRTEQLPLLPNSECQSISQYPLARRNDICSLYTLPCGFHCAVS